MWRNLASVAALKVGCLGKKRVSVQVHLIQEQATDSRLVYARNQTRHWLLPCPLAVSYPVQGSVHVLMMKWGCFVSAGRQGRELQLETGIVPLVGKQACKQVALFTLSRSPAHLKVCRMVRYWCIVMGWIWGVWIISVGLHVQTYNCIAGVNCDCERGHDFSMCLPLDLQCIRIYHFVKYTGDSKRYIFCIKMRSSWIPVICSVSEGGKWLQICGWQASEKVQPSMKIDI